MERKNLKITNCKQFEMLVKLMEKNAYIAKGFMCFGSTKGEFTNIWDGFSDQLNSLGPPVRKTSEWQKVWNDYKAKIKAKLSHNKKELTATGGGCNKLYIFSALEESVIDLLLLREVSQVNRKTFGLGSTTSTAVETIETLIVEPVQISDIKIENIPPPDIDNLIFDDPIPAIQSNNTDRLPEPSRSEIRSLVSKTPKGRREEERGRLLEEQTKSIKNTEKHSKKIARYSRKVYEIKEKKFKLWQEDLLDKRIHRKNLLELKIRQIEYEEKKLAFLERNASQ